LVTAHVKDASKGIFPGVRKLSGELRRLRSDTQFVGHPALSMHCGDSIRKR
jgi:hypothetical protein